MHRTRALSSLLLPLVPLLSLTLGGCGDSAPAAAPSPAGAPPAGAVPAAPAAPAPPSAKAPAPAQATPAAAPVVAPGTAKAPATAPAAGARIRVLVLSGGGFHEFRKNLDLLLPALSHLGPLDFTELPLGPGAPNGPAPAPSPDRAALGGTTLEKSFDVILAYTQGELGLTPEEQTAIIRFVRAGGGFVALHCALDSHPGWTPYVELCGARFERHPAFGPVHVRVDAPDHPVMAGLGEAGTEWELRDEFYHLQDWEDGPKTMLMSGVSPEGGERRPVAWARSYGKGREVSTILGHGPEVHGDPRYQRLVAQALVWAAGRS